MFTVWTPDGSLQIDEEHPIYHLTQTLTYNTVDDLPDDPMVQVAVNSSRMPVLAIEQGGARITRCRRTGSPFTTIFLEVVSLPSKIHILTSPDPAGSTDYSIRVFNEQNECLVNGSNQPIRAPNIKEIDDLAAVTGGAAVPEIAHGENGILTTTFNPETSVQKTYTNIGISPHQAVVTFTLYSLDYWHNRHTTAVITECCSAVENSRLEFLRTC